MTFRLFKAGVLLLFSAVDLFAASRGIEKTLTLQKTACSFLLKDHAVVISYCPTHISTRDMVTDFIELTRLNNWRMPIFEVFNNAVKTPKSMDEYLKLPKNYKYQSYSIQIDRGALLEKRCFDEAKEIKCDF